MSRLSNLAIALMAGLGALLSGGTSRADPAPPALPPHALILFGANWCAPCLAELRDLPAHADAIAPAPVLLAWTDGAPRRLWRNWPANARIVPPGESPALLARIGGRTAGLPYVALLDGAGRLCADLRGKLSASRLAEMRARCAGGGQAAAPSGS